MLACEYGRSTVPGASGALTMYYLKLFNLDACGSHTGVTQIGNPFPTAANAIAEARRLNLATHFQIADEGGRILLSDNLQVPHRVHAED